MKKICAFLMTFLALTFISATEVKAQGITFYEAEYIDGVYMTKIEGKSRYYQKARFFRRVGDNKAAYCLQPFSTFQNGADYDSSITYDKLSVEQQDRITKLAYYGYGNRTLGHNDPIWYAVTQLLIWQTTVPNGNFFFTEGLDGAMTSKFDAYINELNNYVNLNDVVPSFLPDTFIMRKGAKLEITDTNGVLKYFNDDSDLFSIDRDSNKLIIDANKVGQHFLTLHKNFDADTEDLYFFNSLSSQDLMTVGKPKLPEVNLGIFVMKTKLAITKIDADTKSTTPSGEGVLKGAEYDVLDEEGNVVRHFVIDENNKAYLEDLDFGTYYIKETKAGKGYTLDEELHEFKLDQFSFDLELELENKIIKKKLELYKRFGNSNNSKPEAGIVFNVFDNKGELVESIVTDENGYAFIELPYGKYTIKQETTSDGYNKVDDFEVTISDSDNDKLKYDLLDYSIDVPNTKVNHQNSYFIIAVIVLSGIFYVKKKIYL